MTFFSYNAQYINRLLLRCRHASCSFSTYFPLSRHLEKIQFIIRNLRETPRPNRLLYGVHERYTIYPLHYVKCHENVYVIRVHADDQKPKSKRADARPCSSTRTYILWWRGTAERGTDTTTSIDCERYIEFGNLIKRAIYHI